MGKLIQLKDNEGENLYPVTNNKTVNLNFKDLNTIDYNVQFGYGYNSINRPSGSQNGYFTSVIVHDDTTYRLQTWTNVLNGKMWNRNMANGVWAEWNRIY